MIQSVEIRETDVLIIGSGLSTLGLLEAFRDESMNITVLETGFTDALRCSGALQTTLAVPPLKIPTDSQEDEVLIETQDLDTYQQRSTPILLADTLGRLHWSKFVKKTHSDGDLSRWFDGQLRYSDQGKVGLIQLGDIQVSPYPAKEYNNIYSSSFPLFHDVNINFPTIQSSYSITAELIHEERMFLYLLTQLQDHQDQYDLFLLPPALGLKEPDKLLQKLKDHLDTPIAEMLAPPLQQPGHRCFLETKKQIENLANNVLNGTITSFQSSPSRVVQEVIVQREYDQTKHAQLALQTRMICLLSGGVAEQGIVRDLHKGWSEQHFDLPVVCLGGSQVQNPTYDSIMKQASNASIRTNSEGKPINSFEEVCYENLFAAGSVVTRLLKNQTGKQSSEKIGLQRSLLDNYLEGKRLGVLVTSALKNE